jgi:hypothetical protein
MTARVGSGTPLGSDPDSVKPCRVGKTANPALRDAKDLLSNAKSGDQLMAEQQLMQAIGRIERALSRLERADFSGPNAQPDRELIDRHERLKVAAQAALNDIDRLLASKGRENG